MIGVKVKHKNYKEGNEKRDNVSCTPSNKDYSSTILLEKISFYMESNVCMVIVYICNSLYTYHQYYYNLIQIPNMKLT